MSSDEAPPRTPSEWARWVSAGRPRRKRERVCEACGKAFAGTGKARYCSVTCRSRAHRQRVAARKPREDA